MEVTELYTIRVLPSTREIRYKPVEHVKGCLQRAKENKIKTVLQSDALIQFDQMNFPKNFNLCFEIYVLSSPLFIQQEENPCCREG